jgi:hypothetical protein
MKTEAVHLTRDCHTLSVGDRVWIRRPGKPGPHSLGRYKCSRMVVLGLIAGGRVLLRSACGGGRCDNRPASLTYQLMDNAADA